MSDINGGGLTRLEVNGKVYDLPRLTLSDIETIRNTIISGLHAHVTEISSNLKLPPMERAVLIRDGVPAYITIKYLIEYLDSDAGARQAITLGLKRAGIAPADFPEIINNLYVDVANAAAFELVFGPRKQPPSVADA